MLFLALFLAVGGRARVNCQDFTVTDLGLRQADHSRWNVSDRALVWHLDKVDLWSVIVNATVTDPLFCSCGGFLLRGRSEVN